VEQGHLDPSSSIFCISTGDFETKSLPVFDLFPSWLLTLPDLGVQGTVFAETFFQGAGFATMNT
jgi:hypothetical protein